MVRQPSRPGGLPPVALAVLTVVGLTAVAVAALGRLSLGTKSDKPAKSASAKSARDETPVDPFASLPREEWDAKRRHSTLVSSTSSSQNEHDGALPEIDGEGWTVALEAGRLAEEQLERASQMRGNVDINTYKAAARKAKKLFQQALSLGAPILEALGEDAAGTGVERRMSRWTSELVALKKTTGS
jgi:hypothetical protein